MPLEIVKRNKIRIRYSISFVILLIIEVIIALFVHDEFIRPYVGDVLVVALLYCFIRIFMRVIIGSVFDIKDIACYGVGGLMLAGYDWIRYRKVSK